MSDDNTLFGDVQHNRQRATLQAVSDFMHNRRRRIDTSVSTKSRVSDDLTPNARYHQSTEIIALTQAKRSPGASCEAPAMLLDIADVWRRMRIKAGILADAV